MVELSPKQERLVLSILPLIVKWIKEDRELTDTELKIFGNFHPAIQSLAIGADIGEIMDFFSRYKGHNIYGEHIEIILSPKGRDYLEYIIRRTREYLSKKKE